MNPTHPTILRDCGRVPRRACAQGVRDAVLVSDPLVGITRREPPSIGVEMAGVTILVRDRVVRVGAVMGWDGGAVAPGGASHSDSGLRECYETYQGRQEGQKGSHRLPFLFRIAFVGGRRWACKWP